MPVLAACLGFRDRSIQVIGPTDVICYHHHGTLLKYDYYGNILKNCPER